MKKIITCTILLILVAVFFTGRDIILAKSTESTCRFEIQKGWNLKNFAELACMAMKIDHDGHENTGQFPMHLDLFGYIGDGYIHSRVSKDKLDTQINDVVERYADPRVKVVTGGEYSSASKFFGDAETDLFRGGSASNAKHYAELLAREIFTSIWVYNPGPKISGEYVVDNEFEGVVVSFLSLLSGDMSDTEYKDFINNAESGFIPELLEDFERNYNSNFFLKHLGSGKARLEKGWNFMTYNKFIANNNNVVDLSEGDCNIDKAYIFENGSKKWIKVSNTNESHMGSGMIIHNNGSACTLEASNKIIDRIGSWFASGSDIKPPVMP